MKRTLRIILGLTLITTACSSPEPSRKLLPKKDTHEPKSLNGLKDKSIEEELKAELEGDWVNHPFISKVAKTKEVYRYRNELKGLYGFSLKAKGKDLQLKGVYVHEGGLTGSFHFVATPTGGKFQSGARVLELKGDLLYLTEKGKTVSFQKVPSYGNQLNRMLVGGVYVARDENNITSTVVLQRDREYCSFRGYRRYDVILDFTEGIEFDAIVFHKNAKGGNWADGDIFAFQWRNGELILRKVDTNWDTYEHHISDSEIVLRRG